ncbi:MAG: hypothetical protein H0V17_01505 [Deltaproteobacteria bacterium]|nr:hypothetical protein [Deltaproteobacteria bacterium]
MKLGRLDVEIAGERLTLTGRIDDASPLGELVSQLPANVVIDTSGVTFVNSIGMREWIRLLRGLRERGTVTLERVADVLITQMNLIPDLGNNVRIASFHAQYACNACGAEVAPLIDAVAHAEQLQRLKAPPMPCPECQGQMELADFPERYLTLFRV